MRNVHSLSCPSRIRVRYCEDNGSTLPGLTLCRRKRAQATFCPGQNSNSSMAHISLLIRPVLLSGGWAIDLTIRYSLEFPHRRQEKALSGFPQSSLSVPIDKIEPWQKSSRSHSQSLRRSLECVVVNCIVVERFKQFVRSVGQATLQKDLFPVLLFC